MECEMKSNEEKNTNLKNRYEEQIEYHVTTIDEQEMQINSI